MKNYIVEALNKNIQNDLESLFDKLLVNELFSCFLEAKDQLYLFKIHEKLGIECLIPVPYQKEITAYECYEYVKLENKGFAIPINETLLKRQKERIIRNIEHMLEQVALIHLFILGYRGEELTSFKVKVNKNV